MVSSMQPTSSAHFSPARRKENVMQSLKWARSNQGLGPVRLGFTIGVGLLFLVALLCGLQGMTPARADSGALYVDGASGQDIPACGTTVTPCQTISYTLNSRASDGDIIRVAQGTYTENLVIDVGVTLEGGYESSGWTRDLSQYETIIDGSGNQTVMGDWDGSQVLKPAVISDGTEFKMWFDGIDLLGAREVGLAASTDGISWTKSLANPVLTGTVGAWDEMGEHSPFVLKEGGTYKMWYEGSNGSVRQLGYATSTNGIDWTKYAGSPVLEAGPEGYDQQTAGHGSVLNDGGTYKLWYHAIGDQGPIIAYATSADGLSWTKEGPALFPEGGNWDEFGLWGPSVLKLDGMYWMWYSAAGPQGPPAIGVVTSTNGITWTRFLDTPVVTETAAIGDPHVITEGGKLRMWYQDSEQGAIHYAESTDGISWTQSLSNPVLTAGALVIQWGDPVVTVNAAGVVLDGFTITGGSAQRAGGVSAGSNTLINDCLIRDNFADGSPDAWGGGGVLASESVTITNSRITGNQVNQGASGVRVGEGALTMINTLVADNRGAEGMHLNGSASLTNVTVAGNAAGTGGPGINFNPQTGGNLVILNSIIYDNGVGDAIHVPDPGAVQASYSDIQGGWSGTGNVDADPLFVDAVHGDYHLSASSPAVDAGTNAGAPLTDWEDDPRPLDGDLDGTATTDMGADEFRPYQAYLPLTVRNAAP
jgi:predicted GH43/DUF377 family glycosyl hydrolase